MRLYLLALLIAVALVVFTQAEQEETPRKNGDVKT